jgi:hypothetical protein
MVSCCGLVWGFECLGFEGGKRSAIFRFGVKVVWLFLFLVAESGRTGSR